MRRAWLGVGAPGVLAWVVAVVAPASGYTPPELPWADCSGEAAANRTVMEFAELPEEGATVTAGRQVRFSAPSRVPVTFSVASSPALLSTPNIDQGVARPHPERERESMQLFVSSKAASKPGTVYWQASFSPAELPGCAELLSGLEKAPPRTLKVVAPILRAAVTTAHAGVRQITFDVRCNTICAGTASYVVSATNVDKVGVERALGFGPRKIRITRVAGGVQQVTHRYGAASLRKLTQLVRDGNVLEAHIALRVKDDYGSTAVAHKTARLG